MTKLENVATAIEINHNDLGYLIKRYYKARRSLFVWGAPGIGKSEKVRDAGRELAAELKLEYSESIEDLNKEDKFVIVDVRLSQMDPSDLRGIPVPDMAARTTVWLVPETFPRKGHGLLFFDELNLAPPLVQASAYQLILDRRLGTYVVPEGFALIAAGNRLEDRASVFEMSAPLKNRFGHCQLMTPTVEAWSKWAIPHEVDWRILGFLNFRQGSLYTFDPKLKENAFATPRSWVCCSNLIKGLEDNLPLLQQIASTQIGQGLAGELATFIRIKDKLKPISEYLKDPDNIELPNESTQADVTWALITSIAEYYREHQDVKTVENVIKLLRRMNEEYAVFTLELMVTVNHALTQTIIKIPAASKLAKKLIDFFE